MPKTNSNKIQELYLNSKYEVLPNKTRELCPAFTLRFKYKEGKLSHILLFNSENSLLCILLKKEIERIDLNKLKKINICLIQEKIKENNQNSIAFKRNFMKIFFYKKFITQEF